MDTFSDNKKPVFFESENRKGYHRFKEIGLMIEILVVESINYSLHSFSSICLPIPFPLLSSILIQFPSLLALGIDCFGNTVRFGVRIHWKAIGGGSSKMVEDT